MKKVTVFLFVLFWGLTQIIAQELKAPFTEVQPVALNALKTFTKLITVSNYKEMGFDNLADLKVAKLGTPIEDYMVPLDKLANYKTSVSPADILTKTNKINYPVLVNDQAKSSITISMTNGKWGPVAFGGSKMIKLISEGLQKTKQSGVAATSCFTVRIPALNLYFIGYKSSDNLVLVPLFDDVSLGLKFGESINADKVFSLISPIAKNHDGNPR